MNLAACLLSRGQFLGGGLLLSQQVWHIQMLRPDKDGLKIYIATRPILTRKSSAWRSAVSFEWHALGSVRFLWVSRLDIPG